MGLSHSWVAVQGVGCEAVLEALGLEAAGELRSSALPSLGVGELPGGWALVVSDDVDAWTKGRLSPLIGMGSAVACFEEEHVMVCESRRYQDGAEVWRVFYNCEDGRPETRGTLPPEFGKLLEEAERLQAERDDADYIFDVAPQLAQAVCGFRLGETDMLDFRELQPVGGWPKNPGLLQRLFGKK